MTEIEKLKGVYEHFMEKTDDFKNIFDSKKPHEEDLPAPWNANLNEF